MTTTGTRVRIHNAPTQADQVLTSPLPRWLIRHRLEGSGGILPLADEPWIVLVFDVGMTELTLHVLPTIFPRLVEKVQRLSQGGGFA
jgi:hypothetical protein